MPTYQYDGGWRQLLFFVVPNSQMTLVPVRLTNANQHTNVLSLVSSNSLMTGSVYL